LPLRKLLKSEVFEAHEVNGLKHKERTALKLTVMLGTSLPSQPFFIVYMRHNHCFLPSFSPILCIEALGTGKIKKLFITSLIRGESIMKKLHPWLAAIIFTCLVIAVMSLPVFAAGDQLNNDDCIKCHKVEPMDIAAQGSAHKTEVTCIDCHEGHKPSSPDNIPACANCHSGKSHYELDNCLSCHSNPHAPLVLKLAKNITGPCLTCHQNEGTQLQENKSFHSTMACTACHQQHGKVPDCVSCHEPHAEDMVQADCKQCHQAHKPLAITYAAETPSKSCAACHEEAYDLLLASTSKHHELPCAECHQETHKMIPACEDCHGSPHPAGILRKFPECSQCHNIAHDLNRWDEKKDSKK